jgi:hypothetical protein
VTGHPVGTWRARAAGKRLEVTVDAFISLGERQRTAIEQAAATIAPFRAREEADLTFA